MSARSDILTEFRDRLMDALPTADVLVAELPRLGKDDPDIGIAIMPGSDDQHDELPRAARDWSVSLSVLSRGRSWLDFETEVLAAVVAAIEDQPGRNQTLGGRCSSLLRGSIEPVERVEGTRAVGVELTYDILYAAGAGKS